MLAITALLVSAVAALARPFDNQPLARALGLTARQSAGLTSLIPTECTDSCTTLITAYGGCHSGDMATCASMCETSAWAQVESCVDCAITSGNWTQTRGDGILTSLQSVCGSDNSTSSATGGAGAGASAETGAATGAATASASAEHSGHGTAATAAATDAAVETASASRTGGAAASSNTGAAAITAAASGTGKPAATSSAAAAASSSAASGAGALTVPAAVAGVLAGVAMLF